MSEIGQEVTSFRCPKCASSRFDSSLDDRKEVVSRHCRGYPGDVRGCDFSWPVADDSKYFATWKRIK